MELLNPTSPASSQTPTPYARKERRIKPRIFEHFRATVHGVNASGESFTVETVLENISATGLYLCLSQTVEVGAELLIVSQLFNPVKEKTSGPLLALSGKVIRLGETSGEARGVAVEFTQTRFL
jgi:hypothetical protein